MNNDNKASNDLYYGLQEFGLNPNDWTLQASGENDFFIRSISDNSFVFVGKTVNEEKKFKWNSIQLLSI